ncbi:hypothetical protein C2845_PM07G13130 [Panicum miliaceum]|uniref:Uncharacterized protein n=1 Tax=Panicum miliaceum TaxID=4540 RepID=A0A3L6SRW2_PANMI|nr:hypothetical protein C2845_PM07G13130 [Panicum miliaceum]
MEKENEVSKQQVNGQQGGTIYSCHDGSPTIEPKYDVHADEGFPDISAEFPATPHGRANNNQNIITVAVTTVGGGVDALPGSQYESDEFSANPEGREFEEQDIPAFEFNDQGIPGGPVSTDPKEHRSERDKARRASMSLHERTLINQHRRELYHSKRLLKTPQTVEVEKMRNRLPARKEGKREYKRRLKEFRANNLHPDSIAMVNPEFVPKLLFPSPDRA